ncbi:hypothetical protein [Natrinema sp. DC36]|uniref:hypothetical protein n=1 Tax=Natrinema sp. DC36 TaxID=2878680 RepID=UPI001CF06120|nr:hypothetical protein [Natrinema sp. DC36]
MIFGSRGLDEHEDLEGEHHLHIRHIGDGEWTVELVKGGRRVIDDLLGRPDENNAGNSRRKRGS